jgi:SAM-dependent methyltransferase
MVGRVDHFEAWIGGRLADVGRALTDLDVAARRRFPRLSATPFTCSVCGLEGPFASVWALTGRRFHAICPGCHAYERHRLQALVLGRLASQHDFSTMKMLHIAPEPIFASRFSSDFNEYVTGDINPVGVDLQLDLTNIALESGSFDIVYASHVLEHIEDDRTALSEIARVLRPGGFAVLPVPIVGEMTVEYPHPVPTEELHVRAPGPDYFERYHRDFNRVDVYRSGQFPDRYQAWVYEDRTRFPTTSCPYRTPTTGKRHEDLVPVAYVD